MGEKRTKWKTGRGKKKTKNVRVWGEKEKVRESVRGKEKC